MERVNKLDVPAFRALVAEDEAIIRLDFARMIHTLGGDPLQAENGKRAIALCEREWPDICFLDINMPVLDGLGAAKKIRELATRLGRSIYLVAVSANHTTAKESGLFDECLDKPSCMHSLGATIKRALSVGKRRHPDPPTDNRDL